jgi:hypothetical protein
VGGQPDAEAVSRCGAVGRVVAEVAATSKKHRSQAAKCADGNYRGVSKRGEKYVAQIQAGKSYYLGTFDSKEEAARAFDVEAFTHDGWWAPSPCLRPACSGTDVVLLPSWQDACMCTQR